MYCPVLMGMPEIVMMASENRTIFMVDPQANFERAWQVAADYWGAAPYPTVTAVGVTWLYGFDFEIKVIARLPQG